MKTPSFGLLCMLSLSLGAVAAAQAPKRLPIITGAMGVNLIVEVDGTVSSWGSPGGEGTFLGDGSDAQAERKLPVAIPGVHDIVGASVGHGHALLVTKDGAVLGWGRNNGCELGVADDRRRLTPMTIAGVSGAVQVAAGMTFSAAVLADGTVRVWGSNEEGLLANGRSGFDAPCAQTPVPVEGLTGVTRMVVSESDVLVLKQDGTVRMCGTSTDGSLADAAPGSKHTTPFKVGGITSAVAARIQGGSTIVRLKDGTLLGWGEGMHGSLGDGFIDRVTPRPHAPTGLGPVLAHYFASNSGFAIRADGTVMAWGIFVGGPKEWALTPIPFFKVKL